MIQNMATLKAGESGVISELYNKGDIRRRLMDIGFTEGTTIQCVGKSPLGDPVAYLVKGAVIALRKEDSSRILVDIRG